MGLRYLLVRLPMDVRGEPAHDLEEEAITMVCERRPRREQLPAQALLQCWASIGNPDLRTSQRLHRATRPAD
jgi:hypothetical protein